MTSTCIARAAMVCSLAVMDGVLKVCCIFDTHKRIACGYLCHHGIDWGGARCLWARGALVPRSAQPEPLG